MVVPESLGILVDFKGDSYFWMTSTSYCFMSGESCVFLLNVG